MTCVFNSSLHAGLIIVGKGIFFQNIILIHVRDTDINIRQKESVTEKYVFASMFWMIITLIYL